MVIILYRFKNNIIICISYILLIHKGIVCCVHVYKLNDTCVNDTDLNLYDSFDNDVKKKSPTNNNKYLTSLYLLCNSEIQVYSTLKR